MLEGIIRKSIEKADTKKLRRDGYLIANIYGKGLENINAAFKANDYIRTVKSKDSLAFGVKLDGKELDVVVQSYQVHPITGDLVHVDLLVAQKGVETFYNVPVNAIGTPIGLKNKGVLIISKKRLRVKAAIENVPASFDINVDNLDTGDSVLIRDMDIPQNITMTVADRVSVLGVIKAK